MRIHCDRVFSYKDLELYTNGFSEKNFIGKTQFGSVYHGWIPQSSPETESQMVTVKIWEDSEIYKKISFPEDNVQRLMEEVYLLKHPTIESHPHLVKLIGYCQEGEKLGVVYDIQPLNTVHNLLPKGDFNWLNRVKVALQFACLLEYLHYPEEPCRPYLVRNVDAAHIMLDKDYNAKLFDFSMISGGIFPDRRDEIYPLNLGCYGYIDPAFAVKGGFSEKNDVFAFGVLLLGLIAKRAIQAFDVPLHEWARSEYKSKSCSLVDGTLKAESEFYSSRDGRKLTKLAMRCVNYFPMTRPTMKQVVDCLLNLHVVRRHGNSLGTGQLVRSCDVDILKVKDSRLEVARQLIRYRSYQNKQKVYNFMFRPDEPKLPFMP